jgi:hypothetical protein
MDDTYDLKTQGVLDGFQQVLGGLAERIKDVDERMKLGKGSVKGAQTVADRIQAEVTKLKVLAENGSITVEEAKKQREIVLHCRSIAMQVVDNFKQTCIVTQGEAVALGTEIQMINKLHKRTQGEAARKGKFTDDLEQERVRRGRGTSDADETSDSSKASKKSTKAKSAAGTKRKPSTKSKKVVSIDSKRSEKDENVDANNT